MRKLAFMLAAFVPVMTSYACSRQGDVIQTGDADASGSVVARSPEADALAQDGGPPEANERKPKAAVPDRPGVFLVNGASSFPAFRVCKAVASTDPTSLSLSPPIPTAIMPRSNLAGVDVLGAVRVEPSVELGGESEVVLLMIDDISKANPALPAGSCRALACTLSGGVCVGAERLRRVSIVDRGTKRPHPGAFAEPGAILVLRDDAGDLRFEVERANAVPPGLEGDLDVDFHNLSNDLQGSASYSNRGGAPDGLSPSQLATSFQLPSDYTLAKVAFGKHEESLADIHDFSEPRVPIDTYFRAPGAFLLLLVGSPDQDAAPDRKQRFVALPVNGLPDPVVSVDAGTD